ncbi:hypothetical protein FACS18949_16730 [Clostridia bacterium]|nr:hypothetical protein FACS1894202_12700 [Clostridia bacterium]GHV18540.1 hypothetical protein FACS189425_07490 [Clostridia bacterium]GHV36870.1 hypothetical protein FACS18949_16730 [Clostridia bacterium]
MIHDVPKPNISPNFTIEDIHKIREWNYERLKDATLEERLADNAKGYSDALKQMELSRQRRTATFA